MAKFIWNLKLYRLLANGDWYWHWHFRFDWWWFRFVTFRDERMEWWLVLNGSQMVNNHSTVYTHTHTLSRVHIQTGTKIQSDSLITETLFAKHYATSCLNKQPTQMCGKRSLCVCSLSAALSKIYLTIGNVCVCLYGIRMLRTPQYNRSIFMSLAPRLFSYRCLVC